MCMTLQVIHNIARGPDNSCCQVDVSLRGYLILVEPVTR
jgi:hypothetical protein